MAEHGAFDASSYLVNVCQLQLLCSMSLSIYVIGCVISAFNTDLQYVVCPFVSEQRHVLTYSMLCVLLSVNNATFDWKRACIAREEQWRMWSRPEETMHYFRFADGIFASVDCVHLMKVHSTVLIQSNIDITRYILSM